MAQKTRFLVLQSGATKQLFSVEQRPNGDLIIGLFNNETIRVNGTAPRKVRSRKVSVHRSQASAVPGYTFTHQIDFFSGRSHKGHAFVRKTPGQDFLYPFFYQLFGSDMLGPTLKLSDHIEKIASYDEKSESLFACLVVTEHTHKLIPAYGINIRYMNFKYFNINLIYGFARLKSPPSTLEIFAYSGDTRDGIPILSGEYRKDLNSTSIEYLRAFI